MNAITYHAPNHWKDIASPAVLSISRLFLSEELPLLELICRSWQSAFGSEAIWRQKCKDEGVTWQPVEQILLETWRPLVSKVQTLAVPLILVADYLGYDSQQVRGSNMNVYKRQFAFPKPVVAFGPNKWKFHFNYEWNPIGMSNVGPRLPSSVHRDLAFGKLSNCTLTLVDSGHSLARIVEEAKKPFEGPPIVVSIEEEVREDFGQFCPQRTRWVAMLKNVLENSKRKDWDESRSIADSSPDRRMGSVVEIVMSIVAHYVSGGECLFSNERTWTLSRRSVAGAVCVGKSSPATLSSLACLDVMSDNIADKLSYLGVAPVTIVARRY